MLKAHTHQYLTKDKASLDLPEFHGHDCSYESLDKVPQKKFSTKWGPVGFSRSNHVLSVMVRLYRVVVYTSEIQLPSYRKFL